MDHPHKHSHTRIPEPLPVADWDLTTFTETTLPAVPWAAEFAEMLTALDAA